MLTAAEFDRQYSDIPLPDQPDDPEALTRRPETAVAATKPAGGGNHLVSVRQRALTRSQLAELPTPSPLIADTIDLATVALLAGYWGTLKSFVALDWAACVATGFAWNQRPIQPQRVLYIAAEGAHGLNARLSAWEAHRHTTIPDDALVTIPEPVNLADRAQVSDLAGFIADERFGFIVADTLARCAVGMDENSARDMGIIVDNLHALKTATRGGTVAALHHTGKDRTTTRGSSALESGVDTVYKTEGDNGHVRLTREKRKDGPPDDVLDLEFLAVEDTGSGVVTVGIPDVGTGAVGNLYSHFVTTFGATGASKAELRASVDMPTSSFYRALNALVKQGDLTNTGTSKRPYYVAVRQP